MTEPVNDPLYWKQCLVVAEERHHAVFKCDKAHWSEVGESHRKILQATILPNESVLDGGCAWGRLLKLLPKDWTGDYLGVDLSPDFIDLARKENPGRTFIVGDLRAIPAHSQTYDWAILISIRPMVIRNLNEVEWKKMEDELKRVARKILYLEYDAPYLRCIE